MLSLLGEGVPHLGLAARGVLLFSVFCGACATAYRAARRAYLLICCLCVPLRVYAPHKYAQYAP